MHLRYLFVALVMLICCSSQIAAQNIELISHIDTLGIKDFIELNAPQGEALSPLLKKFKSSGHYAKPVIVLKKSKHVSHDLIIVEVAPMMSIPGASFAYVHFFRADGELIRSSNFNLGYRQNVDSMKVVKHPDIEDYLIETDSACMFRGGRLKLKYFEKHADWQPRYQSWVCRQTHAFQNNEVRLIRLVDQDGKPRSNPIYVKHYNYGPVCDYTMADVEKLLQSDSLVDQLHALVWLNGRHSRPCYSDQWYEHQSESRVSIAAYKEAYNSSSLAKLLDEKIKHNNFWISYQAKWVKDKLARPYNIIDPNE